jgi:cardiolipin synthase A/B
VRVILLVQGRAEYFLEHFASRALFGSLLDAGVEIYEYSKGFLHAKVSVIDGDWATVGSSNIDPFSLLLSLEANVVIADKYFGATLAQTLKNTAQKDCHRISMTTWKKKPIALRAVSWMSYGLLRLMKGISGYDRDSDKQ